MIRIEITAVALNSNKFYGDTMCVDSKEELDNLVKEFMDSVRFEKYYIEMESEASQVTEENEKLWDEIVSVYDIETY